MVQQLSVSISDPISDRVSNHDGATGPKPVFHDARFHARLPGHLIWMVLWKICPYSGPCVDYRCVLCVCAGVVYPAAAAGETCDEPQDVRASLATALFVSPLQQAASNLSHLTHDDSRGKRAASKLADFSSSHDSPTITTRHANMTETLGWSGAGMQGRGKREYPEKTRRQAASSRTNPPVIEPGSPWWEVSAPEQFAGSSEGASRDFKHLDCLSTLELNSQLTTHVLEDCQPKTYMQQKAEPEADQEEGSGMKNRNLPGDICRDDDNDDTGGENDRPT
ncbi:hypothetical protein PR048_024413 [Dryococelus australis]|uniref:Uncharacterized protein n=1 Tax=Dryococelus australis TaxID=614101 RepID=A0ABQ9GNK5_9NEOP|nr:hypothetical protein PR048_024413 [Dryococelus australis]